jgi:hypothetical protein
MKNSNSAKRLAARLGLITCTTALILASTMAIVGAADDDGLTVPPVPVNIQPPAGQKAFLISHAVGTQNYICLPSGWVQFSPQATLFNEEGNQVLTHFLSPNPTEGGVARATWQHSRDTSAVWAQSIASSEDPAYVMSGAIPWLLLQVMGVQAGPTGGDRMSDTTFIQRINTVAGKAPKAGCTTAAEVGSKALVPYEADYVFYKSTRRNVME